MPHTVYAFEKPPSPLRELGKVLLALLKTASGTLAEGAVETLAPLVFATIVILTTATAIVLYGIGHVGVSRLTESGVFGLTDESIDTLLGMVKMQWRFLRQLRWSWWLETAARYERRYEEQIDASPTPASAPASPSPSPALSFPSWSPPSPLASFPPFPASARHAHPA
ncbi:hypothetical protein SEUCBS140593_010058 [Sporothrix eucalyptigena]|uniref:Uncharacterized protein n=1 Tax=Sporothrix eucalyptigena TaxID=1812306 RepID=A0ABP0CZT5_9PEZI